MSTEERPPEEDPNTNSGSDDTAEAAGGGGGDRSRDTPDIKWDEVRPLSTKAGQYLILGAAIAIILACLKYILFCVC